MSQVEQLTGQLEKLLEGPRVSPSVGQRAVAVVSELMEGNVLALYTSASRWRQRHPRNMHTHVTHWGCVSIRGLYPSKHTPFIFLRVL